MVNDTIYVGAGKKGVCIYHLDVKNKSISLKQKFLPYITYNNTLKVNLQVSDLLWDPINNQLIIIDEE